MSKELIKAVNSYEKYLKQKTEVEIDLVKAYVMATRVAFGEGDIKYALKVGKGAKKAINRYIKEQTKGGDFWRLEKYAKDHNTNYEILDLGYDVFRSESRDHFESFLFYMEKNRKYDKRFYVPRRKVQRVVVDDLQMLEDDLLDVYGLSEPSRVGKTTMFAFFLAWVGLRKPSSHNAYGGHSGLLAKRTFNGVDNLVGTDEYTYAELFTKFNETNKVVEKKSSDPAELTINLGDRDEFATYTFRGIDGTWTGAIDVSSDGYMCVDDLIRDREHSLSPSRVENTYQEYQNKMLDRMNDGAKKILIGTRWCPLDPLGREKTLNERNERARFREIPALDEKDHSNFEYEVKGFSSKYYIDMRERLDKAEWMAKFQQKPFVREGLLFPIESLQFFDGNVPESIPQTWAALDPAFGGGDSVSMPICKNYDGDKRIVGWVHDKRTPAFTIPKIADKIEAYTITKLKIEKNRGGDMYAKQLQEELDARGIKHCKIELKNAPNKMSKEDKISGYSDYVKRDFKFLRVKRWHEEEYSEFKADDDYRKAIDEMTVYSAEGKNTNDDAPDAITQLEMMYESPSGGTVEAVRNPFRRC